MPAVAFAGALFKPIQLEQVASEIGPAQVSLKWNAEYYGGGLTAIKFTPGVPIKGVEYTQFIGTTARSGDYLVASAGNGKIWKVEASMLGTTGALRKAGRGRKNRGVLRTVNGAATAQSLTTDGSYCLAFDSVTLGPLE